MAPAGAGKFDGVPDQDGHEEGPDGEAAWARDLQTFAETNFPGKAKGVELRTIDQHELKTGFFGCWHEKNGHGEVVEWTEVQHGWELHMVERDGLPVVPSLATAISWVLQMAKGHAKWRVAAFLTRNLQDMNICVRFRAAV